MSRTTVVWILACTIILMAGLIAGEHLGWKIMHGKKIETLQDLAEWYCDLDFKPKPDFCTKPADPADCVDIIVTFCGDDGVEYFIVPPSLAK